MVIKILCCAVRSCELLLFLCRRLKFNVHRGGGKGGRGAVFRRGKQQSEKN